MKPYIHTVNIEPPMARDRHGLKKRWEPVLTSDSLKTELERRQKLANCQNKLQTKMARLKALGALALLLVLTSVAYAAEVKVFPPQCLGDEHSIKQWVETTVYDSPPVGGHVSCLRTFPIKYGERDGGIWVVPAVIRVELDGRIDNEMLFLVYHCETKKGEIYLGFGIPDQDLPKYLRLDSVFNMPTHPAIAILMPTHPPNAGAYST